MNEKKQLVKGIVIGVIISMFAAATVFWGYQAARGMGLLTSSGSWFPENGKGYGANGRDVNQKIERIISILDKHYVDEIDVGMLEEGVYEGLVEGVGDRYTSYMTRDDYASFIETMSGSYAGIGIYVYANTDDRMITVSSPIKGSPGEAAGILPNDKIVKVNGQEVTGDKIDEAISMMKGREGTSVEITIFRQDTNETLDMTVKRAHIDVPTVEHQVIEREINGGEMKRIGYIAISSFDDQTAQQFHNALEAMNAYSKSGDTIDGLIIDVRNNLGGYLNRVVEIADMLLSDCTIVYREDKAGSRKYEKATSGETFDKPIVVLINGASASASEILAGALKDNDRAKLVGSTTFGKGLVQQLFKLEDESAVKVTVERYYTPDGVSINGVGISPDYPVEMPKELESVLDITLEDDTQLQKAIEVISEEL